MSLITMKILTYFIFLKLQVVFHDFNGPEILILEHNFHLFPEKIVKNLLKI